MQPSLFWRRFLLFFRDLHILFVTSPVQLLAVAFISIMLLFPQDGGGNPNARLATLAAFVTEHTLAINNYAWTADWALSPVNGQKYANKPPGPVILAAPVFTALDRLALPHSLADDARLFQLYQDRTTYSYVLSLLLQAIPYAVVALLVGRWLEKQRLSGLAVHFGVLAILFGTTASLFMNSYFGHGMAALFVLAATLLWLRRQYAWSSFFLGWAALSDYGALLLVIPFMASVIIQERRPGLWKALGKVVAGAVVPGVIWSAYHWTLFGSPFSIASRFSNPVFLQPSAHYPIWGLFSTTFHIGFLEKLLIGSERGLLFTQPWVLVTSFLAVWLLSKGKRPKNFLPLTVWALGGLGLLLLANSSFNGWHGGATAGPRYLSSILPVFGIVASLLYAHVPRFMRVTLWIALAVSLGLFVVAYATTILAPPTSLWTFYGNIFSHARSIRPVTHLLMAAIIMASCIFGSMKKMWPSFLAK